MTKLDKEHWEGIRAKGYNRFLLRIVVRTGLPFAIIMTPATVLIMHQRLEPIWGLAAQFALYALAFGAWTGASNWRNRESDCNRSTEDEDGPYPDSEPNSGG